MDAKKTETSNKSRDYQHCNHPSLVRQFIQGAPTGNFVCAQCQRSLTSILRGDGR